MATATAKNGVAAAYWAEIFRGEPPADGGRLTERRHRARAKLVRTISGSVIRSR